MPGEYETFENIYLDLSRVPGRCRFGASGMGWKANPKGVAPKDLKDQNMELWTLEAHEFIQTHWSRASKGYELKVFTRTMGIVQLGGFEQDDLDRVRDALKGYYNVNVEHKEHALKGWNWGKTEFTKQELHFNVANKPAFEIPYSEVSNLNLAGKAEVAVEFASGDRRKKKNKATAGVDELVEMRFFVPGTVKKSEGEDGDNISEDGEKGEEMQAANLFYETLKEKAEIGEVAGVTYATFLDILFLTPRGRYDIDMYENSFRLRGKTYDYKIQYDHVKKFFLLPKPDDVHMMAVIGLEPPLRQGQTRYPFLVMQFKKEEDMEFDLNITEEVLKQKYDGRLQMHYESAAHQVVASIFKGLTGKKITSPSREFASHHQQSGVKCSNKANEGNLFFLDKAFLFIPKPAVFMSFDNVQHVTLSRVGGSVSASRTFDMTVTLKEGQGEYQFNNINREEQQPLEAFLKIKNLRIKNDLVEETNVLLSTLDDEMDEDDDDLVAVRADRGSADEDEESVDEDFQEESESDVAEEYDSAHESSGSSDNEDAEGGDDEDLYAEIEDVPAPPSSKVKVKKDVKKEVKSEGPVKKKVKTKK